MGMTMMHKDLFLVGRRCIQQIATAFQALRTWDQRQTVNKFSVLLATEGDKLYHAQVMVFGKQNMAGET